MAKGISITAPKDDPIFNEGCWVSSVRRINTQDLTSGDNHTTAPDTQQGEDYEHEDVTSQFKETCPS